MLHAAPGILVRFTFLHTMPALSGIRDCCQYHPRVHTTRMDATTAATVVHPYAVHVLQAALATMSSFRVIPIYQSSFYRLPPPSRHDYSSSSTATTPLIIPKEFDPDYSKRARKYTATSNTYNIYISLYIYLAKCNLCSNFDINPTLRLNSQVSTLTTSCYVYSRVYILYATMVP